MTSDQCLKAGLLFLSDPGFLSEVHPDAFPQADSCTKLSNSNIFLSILGKQSMVNEMYWRNEQGFHLRAYNPFIRSDGVSFHLSARSDQIF